MSGLGIMHWARGVTIFVILGALSHGPASAQTTGADEPGQEPPQSAHLQEQERKEPGKIKMALGYIKDHQLVDRFTSGDGFYPRFGGLPTGSGFTVGGGYRRHLLDDHALFRMSALVSTHGYTGIEAEQSFEDMGIVGGFGSVKLTGLHFPQEHFYGLGPHSTVNDRTNYELNSRSIIGTAGVRPRNWLRLGARLGYTSAGLDSGTARAFPTIERLFTDAEAPGLVRQPSYLISSVFVRLDTRDAPGNARRGTHVQVEHSFNRDRDFTRYSFDRTDLEVTHFVPFVDKKQVLVLHGWLAVSDAKPGNLVPFYLLPTVGGGNSVRSLREYRFRDRNALVMNVEYRWEVLPALDMAVFADAGKVSQEVGFEHLKTAGGIGFRFKTAEHVLFRIDVGRGAEGTRVFFKFGPAF
jgi:Omp85 superfamily domain